jgi:rhamnulokinase
MRRFYVACDLGADFGRVMLGNLHEDNLVVSEVHRFANQPFREKGSLQWNIPELYEEVLNGLRTVGSYLEPVESVSCDSWAADYLLFDSDDTLITPAYHHRDSRAVAGMKHVFSKVPWDTVYEETGTHRLQANTLCQLGAESSRRLHRAKHLLPVGDAFNFLLAGVPRVETSLAGTTQLYNPVTQGWSDRLVTALRLPSKLLPPLVPAGTELGTLRPAIVKDTGLEDTKVVTSCSHELAAALAGLPVNGEENWAFLRLGNSTIIGTQLSNPLINEAGRALNFTNEPGYGGSVCFYKLALGLWILQECLRFWEKNDPALDLGMLAHLAGSAPPFASLINPSDPRFLEAGDMPQKILAFCKQTKQPLPRKPGPLYRCVLESLALLHRRLLQELECITGLTMSRLYLLDGIGNDLLNHFTANAVQIPVVVAPANTSAIGNVVVQALALGHIQSLEDAREIMRKSFKTETIIPHAAAWDSAYQRMMTLLPENSE